MYSSSRFTYFFKYFFFPLWIAFFLYSTLSVWNRGDVLAYYWTHFAAPMSIWLTFWFTIFMMELRSVLADSSGLTIFSVFGNRKVDYKDIEYVSEIALMTPARFALKYKHPETGKSKKILVMSGAGGGMIQFIRQQVTSHNPDYSTDLEPSRWVTSRLAFFTAIPFLLYGIVQNLTTWLVQ